MSSCQNGCHVHSSNAGSWFFGLVLGLIGGTTVALLTAPRTGRETRRVLKESARDLPTKLGDLVDDSTHLYTTGLSYLQTVAEEQSGRLKKAMAAGKLAAAKKREELELGNSAVLSFQHR
jgi:gas vesicle protein